MAAMHCSRSSLAQVSVCSPSAWSGALPTPARLVSSSRDHPKSSVKQLQHRYQLAFFNRRIATASILDHRRNGTITGPASQQSLLDATQQASDAAAAAAAALSEFTSSLPVDDEELAPTGDAGDDAPCPAECVREVHTLAEFRDIVMSTSPHTLLVCDFYKTSCGSCKYIAPGFVKLCRSAFSGGEDEPAIAFLKHNILNDDEDEEQTDLAHDLKIKVVPMFKFWRGGDLKEIDSFATRERSILSDAIFRHTHQRLL